MMIPARLPTTTTSFPWVSTDFGPSTFQRQPADQFLPLGRPTDGIQDDRDLGIPSIIYMHNVLPTMMGFKSVQYKPLGEPIGQFLAWHQLSFSTGQIGYLFVKSSGYTVSVDGALVHGGLTLGDISVATHRGVVYLYSALRKAIYIVTPAGEFKLQTPIGVVLTDIKGIASIGPHLVLYTNDTLVRSSVTDPMDFAPSLSTGAGALAISAQTGNIVTIQSPTQSSAVIFTTGEAIQLTLQASPTSPFKMDKLAGVPGITRREDVIGSDKIVLKTTSGYVSPDGKSTQVAPDVWQFLTGSVMEDYIGPTGLYKINAAGEYYSTDAYEISDCVKVSVLNETELVTLRLLKPMKHSFCVVAERWMCWSYGLGCSSTFSHVAVYDTQLKRWGKLRVKHTHVLNYQPSSATQPLGIVIATPEGQLLTLVEDCGTYDPSGNGPVDSVLLYGRLEHARGRDLTLYSVTVGFEYESTTGNSVKIFNSINGHTIANTLTPTNVAHYQGLKEYRLRCTGKGIGVALYGSFNLTSIQVEITAGGYR